MARGRMRRGPTYARKSSRRGAAATTIAKRWRANKARKFTKKPTRYPPGIILKKENAECKHVTLGEQTATLQVLAGSANNGPDNSILIFPAMFDRNTPVFERGVDAEKFLGSWVTPAYPLNHKIELSFNDLVSSHADSAQGFNIDMYVLKVKISGNKADLTTASFATWAASVSALCKREIWEANFDSDFLVYSQKSKTVQVVSKWRVSTSQNQKYSVPNTDGTQITAPPKRYTVNHMTPQPGHKQRITMADNGNDGLLNDCWLPLVMYTCAELTANTGSVAIRHGSRFYFRDT